MQGTNKDNASAKKAGAAKRAGSSKESTPTIVEQHRLKPEDAELFDTLTGEEQGAFRLVHYEKQKEFAGKDAFKSSFVAPTKTYKVTKGTKGQAKFAEWACLTPKNFKKRIERLTKKSSEI